MTKSKPAWSHSIQPVTGFSKRKSVVEALEKLARQLGPGARLPRTRELAQALGITVVTLNLGLTELGRRGLLDRRPRSGIFVSPNIAQKAIGMVLGWNIFSDRTEDAVFYSLLLGCCAKQAEINQQRFSVFLDPATDSPASPDALGHQDLVEALEIGRLDGLLLISSYGLDQDHWLHGYGVPMATLDTTAGPGTITVDYRATIRMAAEELMRQGVRTIGLISSFAPELDFFRQAAAELGFHFEEQWIVFRDTNIKISLIGHGMEGAKTLYESSLQPGSSGLPKGLIFGNDVVAQGACTYLSEHGLRIGDSLMVASHSNKGSHILEAWRDRLVRCEIDPQEITEALFTELNALMAGKPLDQQLKVLPHLRRCGEKLV